MCERLEFIYNSLLSDSPPPGASGGGPARAACILLNYKSARPGLNIYGQRPLICEMKFCGESRVEMGRMQRTLSLAAETPLVLRHWYWSARFRDLAPKNLKSRIKSQHHSILRPTTSKLGYFKWRGCG